MRKYQKIILAVIAAIVLLIGLIFALTQSIVQTTDDFFSAVKQGKMEKAFTFLSKEFKATTQKEELERYFTDNLFDTMKQTSWNSRSRENGWGEVQGSIILENGKNIPITVRLIEEDTDWKIFSIIKDKKKLAGLQDFSTLTKMPDEREQIRLVAETTKIFAQSVHDQSMKKFYDHISYTWQRQTTTKQLEKIFGGFIKAKINLNLLNTLSPAFLKQPYLENGLKMIIIGQYPSEPLKVSFTYEYIYEGLGWKLIGFNIKAQ